VVWISEDALLRIRELESKLAESVPVAVYNRLLERVSELEKRNEWQADMLLRRGQTFPMPKDAPQHVEPQPQFPDETVIAQAEVIRAEGKRMGKQPDEIDEAIKLQTGWTEADIAEAIAGSQG
jgi:hypothetical protein